MFGIQRLRDGAEGQVAKVKKRAKDAKPERLSWKATGIIVLIMAGAAAGWSFNRKTHSPDSARFLLIFVPMVTVLLLWSAANRAGRWLGFAGSVAGLVLSGAPSLIFEGKSNGEQAWVAFGSVSDLAAGTMAAPLAGLALWIGHAMATGFADVVAFIQAHAG